MCSPPYIRQFPVIPPFFPSSLESIPPATTFFVVVTTVVKYHEKISRIVEFSSLAIRQLCYISRPILKLMKLHGLLRNVRWLAGWLDIQSPLQVCFRQKCFVVPASAHSNFVFGDRRPRFCQRRRRADHDSTAACLMGMMNRRGPSGNNCGGRQLCPLLLLQVILLVFLVAPYLESTFHDYLTGTKGSGVVDVEALRLRGVNLPDLNEVSKELLVRNSWPPRNQDLFPSFEDDRIPIVLYVHNRPTYLELVVRALANVEGINETLLIVSHDGFYEDMNAIVEGIRFCQVKQIFAPWSPHLYTDQFPGVSPGDCQHKNSAKLLGCTGNSDQYGNHRSVRIVSLKHHWWWMMNTVWDGLAETKGFQGHMMFIEEDHYLLPNAYRNVQILAKLKQEKCPDCIAVNAAPFDVKSRGEDEDELVVEKVGNVGYTFNRTVWGTIHVQAESFCTFDDYNWDITLWAAVFPSFGNAVCTLRGPHTSAVHFGRCGLHQGFSESNSSECQDSSMHLGLIGEAYKVPNIDPSWPVRRFPIKGYNSGFRGWGGWADYRDLRLCRAFSSMNCASLQRVAFQ